MTTFLTYVILGILTVLFSILLIYLLWYGLKQLAAKGLINNGFTSWSKRRRRLLGILGAFIIYLVLYNTVFESYQNNWGSTRAERQMELPEDDFLPNPKFRAFHAITIDAPPSEVWKWLVQVGGGRAGWYTLTWAENMGGMGIYNKYEIRPEWQSLEKGDLLLYNKVGNCSRITDVVPGKYFVQHWDSDEPDEDWGTAFYASTGETVKLKNWGMFPDNWENAGNWAVWYLIIQDLPDGKSRLISVSDNDWASEKPLVNYALRTFLPIMHNPCDIEMLKQLKDCAEGNASNYKNTPLPEGGIF